MCQILTSITILLHLIQVTKVTSVFSCGAQYLTGYNKRIHVVGETDKEIHCKWTISPPENFITVIHILEGQVDNCNYDHACCLKVANFEPICNQELEKPRMFSLRIYPVDIRLDAMFPLQLRFEYETRSALECTYSEFQCLDKSNCFDSIDMCKKELICNDFSDKRGCGNCNYNATWCGTNTHQCFEMSQRCDGILDCPKGEDELNCTKTCPYIKCPLEDTCVLQTQICDDIVDCQNGFDEVNCMKNKVYQPFNMAITFLICCICSLLFVFLVYRWMTTRRDLIRVMQNLPEFPLAPFQGPGEQDDDTINSSEITDMDIRPGGEIYETYLAAIKKRSVSTKSAQTVDAKYSFLELDGDNELVALASLGIPTHLCVALSVSESSILSLNNLQNIQDRNLLNNRKSWPKIVYREDLEIISEKFRSKHPKSAPHSFQYKNYTDLKKINASLVLTNSTIITADKAIIESGTSISSSSGLSQKSINSLEKSNVHTRDNSSTQWTDIEETLERNETFITKNDRKRSERKRKNVKGEWVFRAKRRGQFKN